MDVAPAHPAQQPPAEDGTLWARHCDCGRIAGLYRDETAAHAAAPTRCDNCGRAVQRVSRTRRDGLHLVLWVCERCTAIDFDSAAPAPPRRCRGCGGSAFKAVPYELPVRLVHRG